MDRWVEPRSRSWTVALAVAVALGLVVAMVVVAAPPTVRDAGTATDGEPTDATAGHRPVVRDISGSTTVSVTYETAGKRATFVVENSDPAYADARHDWAVVPRSALPEALAGLAGNYSAGVAVVGEYALVGNLSTATARLADGSLTVVGPAGYVDPARKAAFVEQFLGPYDLRPDDASRSATLLAVPEALPDRGRTYGTTGYVASPYFWDGDAASVWLHEAIHTRQTLALDREMRWFREASAEYLAARLLQEQYEGVSNDDVRAKLAALARYPNTTLADPDTWDGEHVDYRRGARLLYAVDATVRAGSDGRHTVVDVLRTANGRAESVGVEAFVRIVESHAGHEVGWLRAAITDPGPIETALPAVEHGVFRSGTRNGE